MNSERGPISRPGQEHPAAGGDSFSFLHIRSMGPRKVTTFFRRWIEMAEHGRYCGCGECLAASSRAFVKGLTRLAQEVVKRELEWEARERLEGDPLAAAEVEELERMWRL